MIAGMQSLTALDLGYLKSVNDDNISCLTGLKSLFALNIVNTRVSAKSFKYLKQMPALRYLTYASSNFSPNEEKELHKLLPMCQLVDFGSTKPAEVFEPLH